MRGLPRFSAWAIARIPRRIPSTTERTRIRENPDKLIPSNRGYSFLRDPAAGVRADYGNPRKPRFSQARKGRASYMKRPYTVEYDERWGEWGIRFCLSWVRRTLGNKQNDERYTHRKRMRHLRGTGDGGGVHGRLVRWFVLIVHMSQLWKYTSMVFVGYDGFSSDTPLPYRGRSARERSVWRHFDRVGAIVTLGVDTKACPVR